MTRYGPHREEGAPATVTVRGPERWPHEHDEPLPEALREQRRRINALALERFATPSRLS